MFKNNNFNQKNSQTIYSLVDLAFRIKKKRNLSRIPFANTDLKTSKTINSIKWY